ncbi:hypothetical protein JKP88DRAFT_310955 [Tribonema minus]|uniref:Uncharacterized protein n=1 Tax=Tribonema minus TaxID=303371 RepID=A0A835Z577_9STRA|nr:hypothetical protein JKP88DRAFT_310955 [Tribonema minus]
MQRSTAFLARAAVRAAQRGLSTEGPAATPAATRLAFAESAYGHGASTHDHDVEALKKSYKKSATPDATSKVHSRRSLFDSAQTQQSDDSKTFIDVAKEVKTGTPDITRLSVFDSDYGKEAMPSDAQARIQGRSGKRSMAERVSAVHSRRALFDSVMTQADDTKAFKDVLKEVKTDTPDATRLSVFNSDYGKDAMPANAGAMIEGRIGGSRQSADAAGSGGVSRIHSRRAMFDSVLVHSDDGKAFEDIVRVVKTDTPDVTRLSVFDSDYGKDAMPANADAMIEGLSGKRAAAPRVSAIHSRRAMFDSVMTQADDGKAFEHVVREVKTDTPDITRLSVFDSDYGADSQPHDAHTKIEGRSGKREASAAPVSKVHCSRRAFDTDL